MVSAQNAAQTAVCLLAPKCPTLRRNETRVTVAQRKFNIVRQILGTKVALLELIARRYSLTTARRYRNQTDPTHVVPANLAWLARTQPVLTDAHCSLPREPGFRE